MPVGFMPYCPSPSSMPQLPVVSQYDLVRDQLVARSRTWLVTGAAGFIGSNLSQQLLELGQHVVGLDNFSTGFASNIADVTEGVSSLAGNFKFVEGDIRDPAALAHACRGVDFVLHQAALASVPRSIEDPV